MEAFDADDKYAVYSSFKIGSEDEKFRLTLGSYSGTAGDVVSKLEISQSLHDTII